MNEQRHNSHGEDLQWLLHHPGELGSSLENEQYSESLPSSVDGLPSANWASEVAYGEVVPRGEVVLHWSAESAFKESESELSLMTLLGSLQQSTKQQQGFGWENNGQNYKSSSSSEDELPLSEVPQNTHAAISLLPTSTMWQDLCISCFLPSQSIVPQLCLMELGLPVQQFWICSEVLLSIQMNSTK